MMRQNVKKLSLGAALLAGVMAFGVAQAKDPIKFAAPLDYTAVYTFLTNEYAQGQKDYITMINEAGGIDGHKIEYASSDTGNQPQRGIEAYNRAQRDGAILFDFLSTPVARAMVNRALDDKVVMITAFHGRGDASDGETFPYIFPVMSTYWSQAATLIDYMENHEGGLKGKKVAHVYIDSPFGREPIPVLEKLASKLDFTLRTFPYASPGNEQSSTWSEVRRFRPDQVIIWGAGGGQAVSVREAIRNGIAPDKIHSVVWLAEADMEAVGKDTAKGIRKFEGTDNGVNSALIKELTAKVIDTGKGSGPKENVGRSYYNIGVATMAVSVEAARLAMKEFGPPLDGDKLRKGFEMIQDYDANGLLPKLSFTGKDHQGGGFGRVASWDGDKWVPLNDWSNPYQDIVWESIAHDAAAFKEGR
ncbi:ABC transporter substrate-binding protein [Paenalcaligenes faecalis]|uniref:ABC transporter substrate-binding protein n=1 Tax=Paenalcaligenes faecalis TaxID=2980099 RepID=UPI0022B95CBC|nr:ABC transporter substrate-binding protein [Paenalcaligenes faecalis]